MKAIEKNEAFALFLKGYSQRQVAEMVGVSRSAIERWSLSGGWVEKRIAAQREAEEQSRTQFANEKLVALRLRSERLLQVFDEEIGKWLAYRKGKIRKPGLSVLQLARIAEVAARLNSIEIDLLVKKYKVV